VGSRAAPPYKNYNDTITKDGAESRGKSLELIIDYWGERAKGMIQESGDRRQQRISNNELRTRNVEVRRVRRCEG
jgi:hypothetical protein